MTSDDFAKASYAGGGRNRLFGPRPVVGAGVRHTRGLLAVVLGAALLAGCAQSSVVSSHSDFTGSAPEASLQRNRTAASAPISHVAAAKKHTPFARHDTPTRIASRGIASFYTADQETASGEKFDTNDLTAAHPTLPFGTRLRVTNVSTGRSVTVRVNDRGPYVAGRVVDVSHSAADALGMLRSGIAEVKLDVVQ